MTKEYLKMADVTFGELVTENNGCIFGRDFVAGFHFRSTKHPAKAAHYVAHAINSHDELVAEVERLRGELSVASDALDEVDRVISERIKNGAYDLDDISSEVSYALEQLNRDAY